MTPDTANAAGRSYIRPEQLVWVVVGDRAKIEPGIRALNLGDVQVLGEGGVVLETVSARTAGR